MEDNNSTSVQGSVAIARDQGVAAGERGVATGGDVSQSPIVTGDHNVVNVIYEGVQIRIPASEAIARHQAALRNELERIARDCWGGMSVYIQEEGASLPIKASPYQTGRLGPRQNLLELLHAADRLLVLGDPGSGKTAALERLAAFLREEEDHCFFLFDGLNEVPPPYRDRLVDELVRWMATYPRHPTVLSSRAQDELWRRLRGEVARAIVVQPVNSHVRIRDEEEEDDE